MKVLLLNPPWYNEEYWGVRAGSRWPHLKIKEEEEYMPYPFYLGYAYSLLQKNGFSVTLIDALADKIKEAAFYKKVHEEKPDFILLESSITSSEIDLTYAKKLKKQTGAIIAIAGPLNFIYTKEFFEKNPSIDLAFVGEYEKSLLEVLEKYKETGELQSQPGTILNKGKNTDVTLSFNLIDDLNTLPWPERKSLHMEHYIDAPGEMPLPCAQIIASRGCPFGCSFCMWPQTMYGCSKYRVRDVVDVVDEMEFLVKEMGFKSIYFDDDTFNIGKERMLKLCSEIKRRNLKVPWAIMARADQMDGESLEAFKKANLFSVKYGVETASPELMKQITKGLDLEKVKTIIKKTHALGIRTHLTFTFGIPGETWETINDTIDLALELDPHSVQFSILTPFPNTRLYDQLKEAGNILSYDFSKYDGNYGSVIQTDTLTKTDLENAVILAYAKWQRHKNQTFFDMKKKLEQKDQELHNLGEDFKDIEKNNQETYNELQRVILEFKKIEKIHFKTNEQNQELDKRVKETYTELQRVISEYKKLENKFNNNKKQLEERQDDIQSLQKSRDKTYNELQRVISEFEKLEKEFNNNKKQLEERQRRIDHLTILEKQKQADIQSLQESRDKIYNELQRVISEFEKLQAEFAKSQNDITFLEKNNKNTYDELQRVILEFKKLETDNQKTKKVLKEKQNEVKQLDSAYRYLESKHIIYKKNYASIKDSFFYPLVKKNLKKKNKKR